MRAGDWVIVFIVRCFLCSVPMNRAKELCQRAMANEQCQRAMPINYEASSRRHGISSANHQPMM